MAGLVRSLRRTALTPHSRALLQLLHPPNEISVTHFNVQFQNPRFQSRSYVSDMRRKAFNDNMLRLLRNEIQYEFDRSSPQKIYFPVKEPGKGIVCTFCYLHLDIHPTHSRLLSLPTEVNGFTVVERPGEKWFSLEKRFGEKEEIKLEVTMFDGSVPLPKFVDGKEGQVGDEEIMHITLIVSLYKDDTDNVLVLICSAWPEELEINKIYFRPRGQMAYCPYAGPPFPELDEQLQDSLYEYLGARGIDDALCSFLHNYVQKKDKSEYVRWLNSALSFMKERDAILS